MKKFLLHIVLCIFGIYLVFLGVDLIITQRLYRSDALNFHKWNEVIFDTTNYDLLICGNSRARVFYDPRVIDSVASVNSYNMGMDGHGISNQVPRYYVYLESHPKPMIIVQCADFTTLLCTSDRLTEQYLPYLHYDSLFSYVHDDGVISYIDRYVPFVRYIGYRDVIFEGLGIPNNLVKFEGLYKGYQAVGNKWNDCDSIDTFTFQYEERAKQIFENYLCGLQRVGVSVILVHGPYYRGNVDKESSIEEKRMCAYYDQCAKKYGCHVLNYMRHPICSDTTYFYDAAHVNKWGSQIISQQLAHDVDSIINSNERE